MADADCYYYDDDAGVFVCVVAFNLVILLFLPCPMATGLNGREKSGRQHVQRRRAGARAASDGGSRSSRAR